jgi:alkylation response protein AidB-like acyl-CoA dehydrogenase
VPKKLVDTDGQLTGVRNDVALAGLNHKLGWRGTTNTLLNFGEGKFPVDGQAGAVGYLVGKPHEGLRCMFHMMNEARIGVGMAATMLGMAGYDASLDYAKNRPRAGRWARAARTPAQPQVRIIEHADVKRMLLAQKSLLAKARWRWSCTAPAWWTSSTRRRRSGRRGAPAAGGADAHRQELAQRVVPGGQQPGDPDPRRLRLHARLPGRAVLARQPPEHDPRGHARHPGHGPAGPQGADGRRQGPEAAGRAHQRHH